MANQDVVISIKNLTKKFRVHRERNQTLKDKFIYAGRAKYRDFIALDNVSLEIKKGETIGLIGVNGSGKSTLLKIISRILYPDKGDVEIDGRVSSLLELGAGFHPDFTGEENIFLNGSLMGLSKKDLINKMDAIVEFSELGDFIREPIRGYSSGMYMRLAFSIATAVDPDILLIDEILAVGDAAFQAKCMARLKELQMAGKTIVLVTHDSGSVERFCNKAIWLDKSKVFLQGDPTTVVSEYLKKTFVRSHERDTIMTFDHDSKTKIRGIADDSNSLNKTKDGAPIILLEIKCESELGQNIVEIGRDFNIHTRLKSIGYNGIISPKLKIISDDGKILFESDLHLDTNRNILVTESIDFTIDFHAYNINLMPGIYNIIMDLWTEYGEPIYNSIFDITLKIIGYEKGNGYISISREWKLAYNE